MPNLYGRARRITVFKIVGIGIFLFLVVGLLLFNLFKKPTPVEEIPTFSYLSNYMKGIGYSCDDLEKSGASCTLKKANYSYFFQRYENGFTYIVEASSYIVEFRHVKNSQSHITFITNENALVGYQNKRYLCITDNALIGNLKECETSMGESLDLGAYLGAVESSIEDLKNLINSSMLDVDSLFRDYIWKKETSFR